VSTSGILINSFPAVIAPFGTLGLTVLALVLAAGVGGVFVAWSHNRRRRLICQLARSRGLSEETSDFLGQIFHKDGLDTAETMMAAPELLRGRLARNLRQWAGESPEAYAERAACVLEELGLSKQPFNGAPQPFDQISLLDAGDPECDGVTVWVISVDERNLTVVSPSECPWPMRRELIASPRDGHGEPFRAALLLRPVPPRHEWVLTHDLVDVITNRRATDRVPCELPTHVLPDSGDHVLLREKVAQEEVVGLEDLQKRRGWAQRHGAIVRDLSPEGCKLEIDREVALKDRFHVVLLGPEEQLAALPLAEVMDLQGGPEGHAMVGCRFVGLHLKERMLLAEFVRELARSIESRAVS
jgi:hypothetical protein